MLMLRTLLIRDSWDVLEAANEEIVGAWGIKKMSPSLSSFASGLFTPLSSKLR
jgi:hypothetical protein